jgi:hypothetical protein
MRKAAERNIRALENTVTLQKESTFIPNGNIGGLQLTRGKNGFIVILR